MPEVRFFLTTNTPANAKKWTKFLLLPLSGCPLQGVQVRAGAAAVHGDEADGEEVHRAGVHPGQEDHPPHEASAGVQERDQAELCHSLGDGRRWKTGFN